MKTVVIFCRTISSNGYPFNEEYYWNAYQDLLLALKAEGAEAYFASGLETYKGKGLFSVAYTTDQKCPVSKFRRVENVQADLVYEKGGFAANDVSVLNPPEVRKIAASKIETYRHFAAYQPKSYICESSDELYRALQNIVGDRIVAKVPEGNGGHGVYIGPKSEFVPERLGTYPLLIQEFIDTTTGIPGLVSGIHDLRVKIGGGEIWGGTLRTPSEGEFRANVAQGGTERHLFPHEIPAEAANLAIEIDQTFKNTQRYLAIDFAHTADGWKLIELNSKPGLSPVGSSPQAKDITNRLAHYLVSISA